VPATTCFVTKVPSTGCLVTTEGFGGLVVSMLASGTRVFAGSNPAEVVGFFGHLKNPPHAFLRRGSERICPMSPALRHVKEPSTSVNYECASKIPCIVPSFASRGLSCQCCAWRLWWWMRGTHWGGGGQGYNRPTGCSAEKAPHATFNLFVTTERIIKSNAFVFCCVLSSAFFYWLIYRNLQSVLIIVRKTLTDQQTALRRLISGIE
jgi:hypothetical protein